MDKNNSLIIETGDALVTPTATFIVVITEKEGVVLRSINSQEKIEYVLIKRAV